MKYIQFTHVDAITGISVASEPAANGPTFPAVAGLAFEWARESQYPTAVPEFFGTCPDKSNTQIDGVLAVLTEAQYAQAQAAEMAARSAIVKRQIQAATQRRLDDFAQTRDYNSILSAATYATSTVPRFAADGQYAVEARDATWGKLYEMLGEVEAGTRPMPSGYAEIEPLLPKLEWPA